MMPTLHDGDIVLVDLGRRVPMPPEIFVDWSPSGWSTFRTAIPGRFVSSPTIPSTSPTKVAAKRYYHWAASLVRARDVI